MDSKPRVYLFDTKANSDLITVSSPPSSTSTGSFPIRAPITLDDDDESGFESNGYQNRDSDDSSSYSSGSGFQIESEGFETGEEFETASERHFVGDPDEETVEESGVYDKYDNFRPFVADPDENWLENDTEEEEGRSVVINDGYPVVDNPNLPMPIAHLSMDEEFDELLGDAEILSEVGDGEVENVVKVPDFVVKEATDVPARVKVLEVENGPDDEPMERKDSSFVMQREEHLSNDENGPEEKPMVPKDSLFVSQCEEDLSMKVADGVILGDSVEVQNGVLCSENTVGLPEDNFRQRSKEDVLEKNLKTEECKALENMEHEVNDCVDRNEIEITQSDMDSHPSKQFVESELFEGCVSAFHMKEQKALVTSNGVEHSLLGTELYDASETYSFDDIAEGNEIKMDVFEVSAPNQTQENGELLEVVECMTVEDPLYRDSMPMKFVTLTSNLNEAKSEHEEKEDHSSDKIGGQEGVVSDEYMEFIFATSTTSLQDTKEVGETEISTSLLDSESCQYDSGGIDGLVLTDADEEVYIDRDVEGNKFLYSATLEAHLKTVTNAEMYNRSISADGPEVISLEGSTIDYVSKKHLTEEEKKRIEEIQLITVRFLRLVQRLGLSHEDPMVLQELNKLSLAVGTNLSEAFDLESAKRMAIKLEGHEGKDDLGISLNILVLGKSGVGKSATINSIFGEKRVMTDAFAPATINLKEIIGTIDGIKIRILDTPGLRSSAREEAINRKMLASTKKYIEKFPPDVVLYVDRLDALATDPNDLPLLKSLTNSLGSSIWRKAIVTLTHAASAPAPDGPSGSPLNFEAFVTQRSTPVKQAISQAVGNLFLVNPNMMHNVSLVENHPTCFKNCNGESVLPNGECWRPKLLLLCYSLKILCEVNSLLKKHRDTFDTIKHLRKSDEEFEVEYDNLPPFEASKKSQVAKLDKEQRKAYFEEYDYYRVKLLQKREKIKRLKEVKRFKEINKKRENGANDYEYIDEPTVAFPSFDGDDLEYSSQLLMGPIRVGLESNRSGQIKVKVSSLEQFQISLLGILPVAVSIFRSMFS